MSVIQKIKQNMMTPNELLYLKYQQLPIKKKMILFESTHGREFSGHIFALVESLIDFYPQYDFRIAVKDSVVLPLKYAKFKVNHLSKPYFEYLATAEILINDTSFWSFFHKREDQQYYIFWHGTPLKHLGKATQVQGYGNVQRNLAMADQIFVSNHFTKEIIQKDFGLVDIVKNQIVVAPSPRNAGLFIDRAIKKRFVYMPTWRGSSTSNIQVSLELVNHLVELDELLSDAEEMFVKLHPYEANLFDFDTYQFKHLKKFPEEETYTFLQTVDKIVTDYSSIMFDFIVTNREVILFTYDEHLYRKDRGMYIEPNELPFKQVTSIKDLILALREHAEVDYTSLCQTYCPFDGQYGTQQVLKFILANEKRNNIQVFENWNQKENVLIYAYQLADNGITASLMNFFHTIDLKKRNYILTWQDGMIPQNLEHKIINLPKGVYTFIAEGKVQSTLKEAFSSMCYMNQLPAATTDVQRMYLRDFDRQYPNLHPDYFIHYPGYDRSYAAWMWILKKVGIKTMVFVHTDIEKELALNRYLKKNIIFQAYKEATRVVCVTKTVEEKILKLVPEANTVVLNMPININKIQRLALEPLAPSVPDRLVDILLDPNKKVFINIGRFSKQKGLDRLIKAFESVEDLNAYLILIESYGPEKECIYKQVANSNKKNHIFILKNIRNPYNMLKEADYFIFSSRYEGLGMVVLEALSVDTPVIMTNIPETIDILGGTEKTMVVENSLEGLITGFKAGLDGLLPKERFASDEYEEICLQNWELLFVDTQDV